MKEGKEAYEINDDVKINIMNHCMQNGSFPSMIISKLIVTLSWLDGENLKPKKFSIANRTYKVIPFCK